MKNSLWSHGTYSAELRRQVNSYFAIRNAKLAVCADVMRPGGNKGKVRKGFTEAAFELGLILPHLGECKLLKGGTANGLLLCFTS